MTSEQAGFEDVWRREVPHVLGALVHRYGDFDGCEDAVQEALLEAAAKWPRDGAPANPRGWLVRAASRRLIDALRSEQSRSDREQFVAVRNPADVLVGGAADDRSGHDEDDTLRLLALCCHPALTPASQVTLTLRAVGGLTTDQIAAAFLVPTTTMGQRISRAKATLRSAGARFRDPAPVDLPDRLAAVLHVLYLVFNEGYTASGGGRLVDVSLTAEALRLTRELAARVPGHGETTGLLALMLLTNARTRARTDEHGNLVPLEEQDRGQWDATAIREGIALLEDVLPREQLGPFQLQAAIAAVHAEAPSWQETDWQQITLLYRMLDRAAPGPTVTLNLGVAIAMAHGPDAGLATVEALLDDPTMRTHHRTHAVRAHLLEMSGRRTEAVESYAEAARLTTSMPEQRYLNARARRLAGADTPS